MKIGVNSSALFGTGLASPVQKMISLLKGAHPNAHEKGALDQESVRLDPDRRTLVVSMPVAFGGGAKTYHFAEDGSVTEVARGPVVFPPRPPQTRQILPAGSIPQDVLDEVRQKVMNAA